MDERRRRCVVCGEAAVTDVSERPGLELPVCESHVVAAYRLELYLALEGLKAALFGPFVERLSRLLSRLPGVK